ncbi:MAG: sugar phosphate isomerase/epimerase family protein [Suipraeoptans sp.]
MSKVKIGVCEWALPTLGPYSIKLSHELGFDGLQLTDLQGYSYQYPLKNKYIQNAYLEYAREYNQTLASLHMRSIYQDKTMLSEKGSSKSEQARLTIKKDIEVSAEMNIPVVMLTAIIPMDDKQAFINAAEHIKYACDVAHDKGIICTMETSLPNNQIYEMVELTKGKLRICFDTCNPYIYDMGIPSEMLAEMLQKTPNLIEHYHVKDTKKEDFLCGHPAPCKTGEGDSHLETTAEIVRNSKFEGWVISEVYYHAKPINDNGNFVEIAKEDVMTIRNYFS